MKKLSDYQGEEAIELWADLLDPISDICTNNGVQKIVKSNAPRIVIAKEILKNCKAQAIQVLERIDPEPLNGLNIIIRLAGVLSEIGKNEDVRVFFGYASQDVTEGVSSGSVTESTGGGGN